MTKITKRRWAKSLVFLSLVFVFGFTSLASIISPNLGQSTASAADTKYYIFYAGFPKSDAANLETLKKAVKDNDHENDIFDNTSVRTKGGIFGDKAFELNYDQDKTGCAQKRVTGPYGLGNCADDNFGGQDLNLYVYSADYFCQNGKTIDKEDPNNAYYKIRYEVSVNLGGSEGIFDGNTLKNNTRLHWVGFGTTDTPGATFYGDYTAGTLREEKDIPINRIPKGCLPLEVPPEVSGSSSDDTQKSNKGIINKFMPIYQTTSDAVRKAWDTASKKAGLNTEGAAGNASGSTADEPTLECDTKFLNPLSWVACPLIDGLSTVVAELDNLITSQLSVGSPGNGEEPNQIFCSGNTEGKDRNACVAYKQAWTVFRNLALGLLVVIGLVMILSEVAGMEVFSPYAIKKTMPRLLIGAIGITLSWQLMQFLVEFVNALGYGIRYLIYQPFLTAGINTATLEGGGKAAVGLLTLGGFFALGVMGMLSFVATAAIGVIVALLTIVVREIIIIACVLIAPVAIVLYILPNTERYYKLWWDTFFKALMMFPIIAAMIASGRVFAALASNGNTIAQILGFAAYFAPYFLLPLTFKYSSAAISGIGGFFNNNGVTNWGRKTLGGYRARKTAENLEKARNFERFSNKYAAGRGINAAIGAVANPRAGIRGKEAIRDARFNNQMLAGQEALKNDRVYQANKGDDTFLLAHTNRELAEQKLAQTRAKLSTAKTPEDRSQIQAEIDARQNGLDQASLSTTKNNTGAQMGSFLALAQSGYQFSPGQAGYEEMHATASKLVGADDKGSISSLLSTAQYMSKGAGRNELGGITYGAGDRRASIRSGFQKVNSFTRGSGKKDQYIGGMEGFIGGGVMERDENTGELTGSRHKGEDLSTAVLAEIESGPDETLAERWQMAEDYADMIHGDYGSATTVNQKEIREQVEAIDIATGRADDVAAGRKMPRNWEERQLTSAEVAERARLEQEAQKSQNPDEQNQ